MQWQSFTTLLYQRAILRNAEASIPIIWLVDSTIILTLLFLLTNYTQIDLTSTIISLILGGLALFIMKRLNNKSVHKLTYGEFLKPFVPQWNGDVRVLQSTMHSQIVKGSRKETNPIADGIMFGLNSPSGQKLKLSDIHLLTPHSVPSDVNSLILQNILSAFTMSQKKMEISGTACLLSRYHMLYPATTYLCC